MEKITIDTATPSDLSFIIDLQKKFTDNIGFLPKSKTENSLFLGKVLKGSINEQEVGFLLFEPQLSCQKSTAIIVQAAVHMDAQRRRIGISLLNELSTFLKQRGSSILQATCLEHLEATDFWKFAGFTPVAKKPGGSRRDGKMIIWRKALIHNTNIRKLAIPAQPRGPKGLFTKKGMELPVTIIGVPGVIVGGCWRGIEHATADGVAE